MFSNNELRLVSFLTLAFCCGVVSTASAEVPCDEGYTYKCDAYNVCGCELNPPSGGEGFNFVQVKGSNGDDGDILAIDPELLIDLSLAAGLDPEEVYISLLAPVVMLARR